MLRVVDVLSAPDSGPDDSPPGVIAAVGSGVDIANSRAGFWLDTATFTLTEDSCVDRRVVTVDSVAETLAELTKRCQRWPHASSVCDDVLRAVDPGGPTQAAVVTESLAYSTLQAGPEFARWLEERGPARMPDIADPVQARLLDIIEAKKKGAKKAKAKPSAEPEPPSNVINIMDALRRSVAAAKKTKGR